MFRITEDPSSGSDSLYLIGITYDGPLVLIMCVIGVWRHILDVWCVCTASIECISRLTKLRLLFKYF
jgi:hypothetical protein